MAATPQPSPSRVQTRKRGRRHTLYLVQFAYTADAWKKFVDQDVLRDRIGHLRKLIETLGGCFASITIPCEGDEKPYVGEDEDDCDCPPRKRVFDKCLAFNPDHQVTTLIAFPSPVAANAFGIAVCQGGLVTNLRMTPLLSWSETMTAMARAKAAARTKGALPPGWA